MCSSDLGYIELKKRGFHTAVRKAVGGFGMSVQNAKAGRKKNFAYCTKEDTRVAVPIGLDKADATLIVKDSADPTKGVLFGETSYGSNDTLQKLNSAPTPSHGSYASQVCSADACVWCSRSC